MWGRKLKITWWRQQLLILTTLIQQRCLFRAVVKVGKKYKKFLLLFPHENDDWFWTGENEQRRSSAAPFSGYIIWMRQFSRSFSFTSIHFTKRRWISKFSHGISNEFRSYKNNNVLFAQLPQILSWFLMFSRCDFIFFFLSFVCGSSTLNFWIFERRFC